MSSSARYAIEGNLFDGTSVVPGRIVVAGDRIVRDAAVETVWRLASNEVLLPAFHDHHTHLAGTHRPPRGPDLSSIIRRRELFDAIRVWIEQDHSDRPVVSEGFDESAWDEAIRPTRAELDSLSTERPIVLRRVCGHIAIANGAALQDLGLGPEEADPESGVLFESAAMSLSERWPVPVEEYEEGILRGQRAAGEVGVVGIDELGRRETYQAYRNLEASGRLWLRVDHYFPLSEGLAAVPLGEEEDQKDARLRRRGLKGFLDGSIGARSAAIDGKYRTGESSGRLLWRDERLRDAVHQGVQAGLSIALHAIGRRAIDQAVRLFEMVPASFRTRPLRIEHAEETDEALFDRGRGIGVVWSMQPNFTARWQGREGLYHVALGDRGRIELNRFRSAARSGTLLFGSDMMPFDPLLGIAGAMGHPDPEQRLALGEAVAAYGEAGLTTDRSRPLQHGARADLVVLRVADLDGFLTHGRGEARVVWTAAAGRPVWCAEEAGASGPLHRDPEST